MEEEVGRIELVIAIKKTGMGGRRLAIPIDSTVEVEEYWGRGTHGEARVKGHGRYLLVNVSNRGNHNCQLRNLTTDGRDEVIDEVRGVKYCRLCKEYLEK